MLHLLTALLVVAACLATIGCSLYVLFLAPGPPDTRTPLEVWADGANGPYVDGEW